MQLLGAAAVVIMLVVAAIVLGRRPRSEQQPGGPGLVRTALVALPLAVVYAMLPQTWAGVTGSLVLAGLGGVLLSGDRVRGSPWLRT